MATAPAKDAAATSVDVAAYRRDHEDAKDDQVSYALERDAQVIFDTPAEDLIFIDPDATRDEVDVIFGLRHPPSHPALVNLTHTCSANRSSLPLRYRVKLRQEWYAGFDVQQVCEIAKTLGKPVRVVRDASWRRDAGWKNDRRLLYERGCYLRTSDDGLFVIYNPKIAARGLKRMAERGSVDRVTPYVTCAEFMVWARAMQSMNTANGFPNITGHDNCWNWRRVPVMDRLHRDLTLFVLLYGRSAYWQLEEFRTLIETWKKKGPVTWTVFEQPRTYGCTRTHEDIFSLLDEEAARKRKPRKRELKLRLPKGYRWK